MNPARKSLERSAPRLALRFPGVVQASRPFLEHRTLWGLLAAAAILRLIGLSAFPEIQADEGLWTNSPKNFVAFGDWFMDGRTHLFLSPLFSGLAALSFWVVGPSIAAARMVSAVAGVASVGLLYATILRALGDRRLAFVAATLLAVSPWAVMASRQAMIESLQLSLCLAALYLALDDRRWSILGAGLAFGLALLAKSNAIFLAPVLALVVFWRRREPTPPTRAAALRSAAFILAVAMIVAGSVYAALYLSYPTRFMDAFQFELDGVHFEQLSHPLIRVGRFGLDPEQAARTLLALFREAPFLMVLAALGIGVCGVRRPQGSAGFMLWLCVGLAFFLTQTFQPLRYFLLVAPALAFAAATALLELGRQSVRRRLSVPPLARVAITICIAFDLFYLGASALANRARILPTVVPWVRAHVPADANVMAAGWITTDLPNRAYAHYHLAQTPEQLLENVQRLNIRYLIVDYREWPTGLQDVVGRRFGPPLQAWSFGAVYAVDDAAMQR